MGKAIHASKLDLSNRGLTEIPSIVFEYKNLKKLDLSNNKIRTIPKDISNLSQLKSIDLSNNELSVLKSKFFELRKLETLILCKNRITSLPKQIGNLTKIKKINLSDNQLEALPKEFKTFQELRSLHIGCNRFTKFPTVILGLQNLKTLWLGRNVFMDFPLTEIGHQLPNLKALYCFNPQTAQSVNINEAYSILQKQKGNVLPTVKLMTFKNSTEKPPIKKQSTAKHIFICYSRQDEKYRAEIEIALQGMNYIGFDFEFWCDNKIVPGQDWRKEIEAALDRAGIAIFVVSRYFLASKFIQEVELPRLLVKAENEGTEMLCIIARRCIFKETILGKYQTINTPDRPLNGLSEDEQEGVYYNLVQQIKRCISGSK